jgi:AcrR family transcriptional regulator
VTTVTTDRSAGLGTHRQRLLDGLTTSIVAVGYRDTTVADIVRHARTSRRTFYEQFTSKEACFVALLADANTRMVQQISAAVDPAAPWEHQMRQAVEAWIACAESSPAITLSWIRDLPSLGTAARQLQRELMEEFIVMLRTLWDTDECRAIGVGPVTRQLAITLLGGLRELIAATVEDGGRVGDIVEVAVRASVALLRP